MGVQCVGMSVFEIVDWFRQKKKENQEVFSLGINGIFEKSKDIYWKLECGRVVRGCNWRGDFRKMVKLGCDKEEKERN